MAWTPPKGDVAVTQSWAPPKGDVPVETSSPDISAFVGKKPMTTSEQAANATVEGIKAAPAAAWNVIKGAGRVIRETGENLIGAGEVASSGITGLGGQIVGTAAGVGAQLAKWVGRSDTDPLEVKRNVQDLLTYKPQTAGGQRVAEAVAPVFGALAVPGQYLSDVSKSLNGGKENLITEATKDVTNALVAKKALDVAPTVIEGGVNLTKGAARVLKKGVDTAIANPVETLLFTTGHPYAASVLNRIRGAAAEDVKNATIAEQAKAQAGKVQAAPVDAKSIDADIAQLDKAKEAIIKAESNPGGDMFGKYPVKPETFKEAHTQIDAARAALLEKRKSVADVISKKQVSPQEAEMLTHEEAGQPAAPAPAPVSAGQALSNAVSEKMGRTEIAHDEAPHAPMSSYSDWSGKFLNGGSKNYLELDAAPGAKNAAGKNWEAWSRRAIRENNKANK